MLTVCGAPTVETGPKNNGGEFLEPPILTTPQRSNAWSPSGGVELEGVKRSTVIQDKTLQKISSDGDRVLKHKYHGY